MIRAVTALILTLLASDVATAAATLPSPTASPVPIVAVERSARLNRLKTTASAEIDRRLAALEAASSHLDEGTTMPDGLRDGLAAALASESQKLSSLKSKLGAESDLAAARMHVQAVLDEYKTYGLLVPRTSLASSADRLQGTATLAAGSLVRIEAKLTALDSAGRNTRDLHRSYDQAMAMVSGVNTRLAADVTALSAASEADYVAAHKALTERRDSLQTARDDLASVRGLIESMTRGIDAVR